MKTPKHGVWKHATPEELAIQEELSATFLQIKELAAQAKRCFDGIGALEARCNTMQAALCRAGFDLAARVKGRHAGCLEERD